MRSILVALLILPAQAHACMWVDGTTLDGHRHSVDEFSPAIELKSSLARSPEDKLEWLDRHRKKSSRDEFTHQEMDGVRAVLAGRHQEAIAIFLKIEADHPGRYSTASNLGTAYELNGELEPALHWITEGIRRNPESHHGTEWLHQEILKARMKLAADPAYLRTRSIIPIPAAISKDSRLAVGGMDRTFDEISNALEYQLGERMVFVKPPDPVVADLLFSFANLAAQTATVEPGIALLELARTYGFQDTGRLDRTLKEYESAILYGKIRWYSKILAAVLGFIAFLVIAWKKKWFFLTGASSRRHQQEKSRLSRAGDSRFPIL